ncbi:hypothetical protein KP509_35G037300 [Ceratopteris richardii]|uniref:Glutaredoxin domain-containing protein n=1 Tax=Ceratopteris richardii TaxID=49495 RepID=A0A8T2QEQ4_CERRI|nr:hypothetical protein KP509_35G037300 [Ceratopteris richardii]
MERGHKPLTCCSSSVYRASAAKTALDIGAGLPSTANEPLRSNASTANEPLRSNASTVEEKWENRIACENAVVVVSKKGCCMSQVVTRLLYSLGANPYVLEIKGSDVMTCEQRLDLPAVFVGGRLLGGVDRLLAAHISGSLIPQLKAAGALWL